MVSEPRAEHIYDISRWRRELVLVIKTTVYEPDWSFVLVEAV